MKHKLLFLLPFFSFSFLHHFPALAQNFNAEPGYLVTPQRDTVRGWIRGRTDLSEKVLFKADNGTDFEAYTPDRAVSFYYPGGYYKAMEIPAGDNQNRQVFLLCLVEGNLSLYQYKDVYYLGKANQPFTKLEKQDVMVEKNFSQYKKIDNRYKGLLNYIMADCPSIRGRVEKTQFEAVHMTNLVSRYNQCVNTNTTSKQGLAVGKPGNKIRAGFRVGMVSSNADFFTEGRAVRTYDFEPQGGYTGGVFVVLAHRNQVTIQPEMLLTRKGASYRRVIVTDVFEERGSLSQTYLQVPLSIYYTPPVRKVKPFVSAGGFFGYALSGKVTRVTHNLRTGEETNRSELNMVRGDFGYRGGAGISYQITPRRAVGLEYHYEQNLVSKSFVYEKIRFTSHILSLRIGL